MSLVSSAQSLFEVEEELPESLPVVPQVHEEPIQVSLDNDDSIVVYDEEPTPETVLEVHDMVDPVMEVSDVEPAVEDANEGLHLSAIPGAPAEAQDEIVVEDPEVEIDETPAAPEKPIDTWDWQSSHGVPNFVAWVKDRFANVPKHDGKGKTGLQRALAYLEKVDGEISKAMRADFDSHLDADQIEMVRGEIEKGIRGLESRIDALHGKKRKKSAELNPELIKAGQKIAGVQGVMITVPLLISRCARVCINGTVSAGHSIEDLFSKQVKAFDLSNREQAELIQLLEDMGYPVRRDRLEQDGEFDATSSNNGDFSANYPA
jgi:hypothetical protein